MNKYYTHCRAHTLNEGMEVFAAVKKSLKSSMTPLDEPKYTTHFTRQ